MMLSGDIDIYDIQIVSEFYKEFIHIFSEIIKNIPDEKERLKSSLDLYKYHYVIPNEWIIFNNDKIVKTKYKLFRISEFMNFESVSMIQYKPMLDFFFNNFEVIKKHNLLKNKIDILEVSNLPNIFEACQYYDKKYNTQHSKYDLNYFRHYAGKIKDNDKYIEYYKQFIKINAKTIDDQFTENMINEKNETYDLIFATINSSPGNVDYYVSDIYNFNTNVLQLYYSLIRLKLNGTIVFNVLEIKNKRTADLIILVSKYFKKYELNNWQIQNKYKWTYVTVIFKKLQTTDFTDMLKIVKHLLKQNENSKFLTSIRDQVMKLYPDQKIKPITEMIPDKFIDDNTKYITSLLDNDLNDKIYDKIRNFNKEIYFSKLYVMNTLKYYSEMDEKTKKKYLEKKRQEQKINALVYAKRWNFKTIPISNKNFDSEFGRMIIKDMYSQYKQIMFEFIKYDLKNDSYENIPKSFIEYDSELQMADYTIDTRNIIDWDKMKHIVRFYRPFDKNKHLNTIIDVKYNQQNVSQAWIKMYEILVIFNLIPKNGDTYKTFNMCEAPGNFISAINHYIKTETTINNFDWYAQSLNPDHKISNNIAFKDDFGYIKKYKSKWLFGADNTGDITNIDNIKWYRKYTLDRDVNLITSDCGTTDELGYDFLIRIHTAQLIFILYNLPEGGSCVAKMKIPIIYSIQVELYYRYYKNFKHLYFFKGHQNPSSKEFYLVGIGYKRLQNYELDELIKMFENYEENTNKERKYPESFLSQLEKIYSVLKDNYIFNFERKLFYVDNYKSINNKHFKLLDELIDEKNNDWLRRTELKKINNRDKI